MSNAKNLSFKDWVLLERYPNIPTSYETLLSWPELWNFIADEYKQRGGLEMVSLKATKTQPKVKRIALNQSRT